MCSEQRAWQDRQRSRERGSFERLNDGPGSRAVGTRSRTQGQGTVTQGLAFYPEDSGGFHVGWSEGVWPEVYCRKRSVTIVQ